MKRILLPAVFSLVSLGAMAADAPDAAPAAPAEKQAAPIPASKREKIEKLLAKTKVKEMLADTMGAAFKGGMEPMMKTMPEAQKKKMARAMAAVEKILQEEMSWEKMKDPYIAIYADHYTEAELDQVLALVDRPEMQLFLRKQTEMIIPSMKIGQDIGAKMQPRIMQTVMKEMSAPDAAPAEVDGDDAPAKK